MVCPRAVLGVSTRRLTMGCGASVFSVISYVMAAEPSTPPRRPRARTFYVHGPLASGVIHAPCTTSVILMNDTLPRDERAAPTLRSAQIPPSRPARAVPPVTVVSAVFPDLRAASRSQAASPSPTLLRWAAREVAGALLSAAWSRL